MCRDFEKIKANMNFQKSKHHFQNLWDIWNNQSENNSSNCISSENCHCNCKADMCYNKKKHVLLWKEHSS